MGRGKRGNIAMPEVVTLLSLKKLCLSNLRIWGETFSKILSGCPVIEDLSIKNCMMSGSGIISSTTLKFLSWEGWIYLSLGISAPNLVSLEFSSSCPQTTLMNLSSLVFAHVNYGYPNGRITASLSAVQHLDLSGSGLKTVLDEELTMLPRFDNLKCLSLKGWCMACHSGPVAWFLENSPNLDKLTVWLNMQHCLVRKKRNHHNLRQIEAPRCQTLKKLVIRVSKGYKRAYGSGMAFLKVAEEIEISEVVLCNRVWIRNGFFKKL
ncbi:putative F-box/LRR-repeat protein At5g02930 [Carex rostrata]